MSPIIGVIASSISGRLWEPQGAYDALATVTVPSGGVASITFAGIPNDYKHLQIRGLCGTTTNASINMYYNSDTTAGNYAYHRVVGDGSGVSSAAGTSLPRILDLSGNSTFFYASVIDVLDYASTSKNKTARALQGYDTNGGPPTSQVTLASELWLSTAAVNSVQLTPASGNFVQHTQFTLYGVR
jgi:hypothetical protein